MADCKGVYGIQNVCGDLLQASGADKDFFTGYISDLGTWFDLTQSAVISSISFVAYAGLQLWQGQKFSHVFDWELAKGAGGSISYTHKAKVKLMALSVQDDIEIQRLSQAQDAFIIWQDNNNNFFIHAPGKGMLAMAGPLASTGEGPGLDRQTIISLEGNEKVLPLRFSTGTAQQTYAYLTSLIR